MRIALSFLFLLYFLQLAAHTIGPGTYVISAPIDSRLVFHDSTHWLLEEGERYDIEDILNGDTPDFEAPGEVEATVGPFYYWLHMRLTNATDRTISGELILPSFSDTVWVHTVMDDKVVDLRVLGNGHGLRDKNLRGSYNTTPFSLDPGVVKTIYCRVRYLGNDGGTSEARTFMGLLPRRSMESNQLDRYFEQGVFAGLMLLFCLVSVFLFVVFRERIFLYFAGLMLSFGLYFLLILYVFAGQFNLTITSNFVLVPFTIGGIVLFLSLFTSNYLQLRSFLPRVFKWYAVLAALVVLTQITPVHWISLSKGMLIKNYIVAAWMLFTICLIAVRAVKKDKPARVMLLSIIALFVGGSTFMVNLLMGAFIEVSPVSGFQIGTVAFAFILFYSLFDKYNFLRAEKLRMEKLDELKSRFFANISHEFRTPLTLMLGPIHQVMENASDPRDKRLLRIAHRNAGRQLSLVNQLLDLAKAESGKLRLQAKEQDFIPLLRGTVYSFASLAEQRNLRLEVDCPQAPLLLYFDQEKMEQIITNLVANACKFTPEGGRIRVALKPFSKTVQLVITDTGQGISPERLAFVFDRFFRAVNETTETTEGHGIGLALVKELVELHHGTVEVSSRQGKGTTVSVVLPRGKTHLQPEELVTSSGGAHNAPTGKQRTLSEEWPLETSSGEDPPFATDHVDNAVALSGSHDENAAPSGKKHVLIIEDNADVRLFIRQRLDPAYHVTEAADGEAGVRQALTQLPDLIISDVMMPGKDGYEVCQTLKTDVRSSHIPVILLTAKAGREEKLEGLETGADDYLTKPFDAQELELRVANLLRLREQLRQRFATSIAIRPSEIVTNSLDQNILELALAAVESNIGNRDFNVDAFAREVGMSKPNLNRKLRALVNQSSNQFIQSVRLQRSAELLRRKTGNVGEVAIQTGFGSTAYFVKCFGDHFGVTPGNFGKDPS